MMMKSRFSTTMMIHEIHFSSITTFTYYFLRMKRKKRTNISWMCYIFPIVSMLNHFFALIVWGKWLKKRPPMYRRGVASLTTQKTLAILRTAIHFVLLLLFYFPLIAVRVGISIGWAAFRCGSIWGCSATWGRGWGRGTKYKPPST